MSLAKTTYNLKIVKLAQRYFSTIFCDNGPFEVERYKYIQIHAHTTHIHIREMLQNVKLLRIQIFVFGYFWERNTSKMLAIKKGFAVYKRNCFFSTAIMKFNS